MIDGYTVRKARGQAMRAAVWFVGLAAVFTAVSWVLDYADAEAYRAAEWARRSHEATYHADGPSDENDEEVSEGG